MHFFRLFAAMAFVSVLCAFGPAMAADWTVERVTMPAQFSTDGQSWSPVVRGMEVPNAAWINTGRGGRVSLSRGSDSLLINANSLVSANERGSDSQPLTTVTQRFGETTINLQRRGYDQMTVSTPYMVAVVKGTKFSVYSRQKRASLRVYRGLVEVADPRGGARAQVGAGGKAEIDAVANTSISLSGSNTAMVTETAVTGDAATGLSNQGGSNGAANSGNANAGAGNNNAGGNSSGAGNSGNSNAGGNSGNSNSGGNSGNSNSGGNSGNSNSGSGNSNAGGNSNGAGNSGNSNAGGNGNGRNN